MNLAFLLKTQLNEERGKCLLFLRQKAKQLVSSGNDLEQVSALYVGIFL